MQQTQQKRAWQRGVRAAIIYKKLRLIFSKIDRRCVMAVQRSDLPAWCGHIPIISLLIGSLIAFAIGGFFFISAIIIFWGITLTFGFLGNHERTDVFSATDEKTSFYCFDADSNIIDDREYHGAPYKSPGED